MALGYRHSFTVTLIGFVYNVCKGEAGSYCVAIVMS